MENTVIRFKLIICTSRAIDLELRSTSDINTHYTHSNKHIINADNRDRISADTTVSFIII